MAMNKGDAKKLAVELSKLRPKEAEGPEAEALWTNMVTAVSEHIPWKIQDAFCSACRTRGVWIKSYEHA